MESYQTIIVGAGLAGAAVARALVRRGHAEVLLLDMERVPGVHSSGRNAGMVRRAVSDPVLAPLALEGADEIASLPIPFRRCGSFLLGAGDRIPREVLSRFEHEFLPWPEGERRVPLLEGACLSHDPILFVPADGIVEVHALLQLYLSEAREGGATVSLDERAIAARFERGRVAGLTTDSREIEAEGLVVAAGAWAGEWGARCGLPLRLEPRRRHLIATELPDDLGEAGSGRWPWVWDLDREFYFRPESAGLLWSPGDETPQAAGPALADADAVRWLAQKVSAVLPRAADLRPVRAWAGHRTFAPDRRFVLGPDPRVPGWHWAAGLGGHGVTASSAVGRRVAEALLGVAAVEPALAVRPEVLPEEAPVH